MYPIPQHDLLAIVYRYVSPFTVYLLPAIYIQGLRSRKEEWTFSRKAEKHKWRNWRLENAKRSIYSTTVQDGDDYDHEFVILIHSPSP